MHIIGSVSQVITSLYRYAPTIGAKEVTRYVKRVWILVLPESYDLSRLSAQSFEDCVSANSTTEAFALPSRALGGHLCARHSVDFGASSRIGYLHALSLTDKVRLRCLVSNFTILAFCGGLEPRHKAYERNITNEMKPLVTRIGDDPIPSGSKPDVLPNSNSRVL